MASSWLLLSEINLFAAYDVVVMITAAAAEERGRCQQSVYASLKLSEGGPSWRG